MPLTAGELDRRVRIEVATDAVDPNGSGEPTTTWAHLATVWASVRPISGRELFAAQQVGAKVDTRFRIRYRTDVHPERSRLIDDLGRVYDIRSLQEIGRREGL